MDEHLIQNVVLKFYAAMTDMNVEAWLETLADDAVSHDPVGAAPRRGRKDHRAFFQQTVVDLFREFGIKPDYIYICADEAAVKWTASGVTHKAEKVHFEGIDIFQVNAEGKISSVRAYWDPEKALIPLTT